MKTIEFKDKKYQVPESWDEVTLKQQIEVSKIAKNQKHIQQIALVAGYTGIDIDVLKKTNIKELQPLFKKIEFVSSKIPDEPIERFTHNGVEYSVTPTLLRSEFQDFISLENIVKDFDEREYEALPIMIAILAKKDGESLDDFDIMERSKAFEDLSISTANRLKVFFYLLVNQSLSSSEGYSSLNQVLQKRIKEVKGSLKKQDGKGLPTRLLRGISRKYIQYIEKAWNKYYTSLHSKE